MSPRGVERGLDSARRKAELRAANIVLACSPSDHKSATSRPWKFTNTTGETQLEVGDLSTDDEVRGHRTLLLWEWSGVPRVSLFVLIASVLLNFSRSTISPVFLYPT
jgi:hypothetical protein